MWLFVSDLIMENRLWCCSQRTAGLWHLCEKYPCCASFCHRMPVDKDQPLQNAKRECVNRAGMRREEKFCSIHTLTDFFIIIHVRKLAAVKSHGMAISHIFFPLIRYN